MSFYNAIWPSLLQHYALRAQECWRNLSTHDPNMPGETNRQNSGSICGRRCHKTRHIETLIDDLRLTFENLRTYDIKLNPEKCVFGVPSGKLLGFIVSNRGIEANLAKIRALS